MTQPENEGFPAPEPTAPARLVEDLGRLHDRTIPVPAATDAAVLGPARRVLGRRRTVHRVRWVAATAAAVLLLALSLPAVLRRAERRPGPDRIALHGDLDASGRVDILDAFVLARGLRAGAPLEEHWDVTGDGRVDADDVDWIARRAVRLDQ